MSRKLQVFISFRKRISRDKWRLATLIIVALSLLFVAAPSQLKPPPEPLVLRHTQFDNFTPSLYPQKTGVELPPYLSAQAVVARDLDSGVTLFEVNPNERLYPASITKLMTALVALDYYSPDQVLIVKRLSPVPFESDMGLAVGDQLSVRSLLYGLLVPSGGDAAYTLADNFPGGIENFLYAANQKAKQLHMENTHFENPSGFDGPTQYSSAHDISLLAMSALKNSLINKIVATYGITVTDATGTKTYNLKNVNQFLGYLYGADGVKTGYTDLAGQCLVSSVTRNGHRVVAVVLDSTDRFGDSARLIEWIFRNFTWISSSPPAHTP